MKTNSINQKMLNKKLASIKARALTEHGRMIYNHLDAEYMIKRAKEEILNNGDLNLACTLIVMSEVKNEPKTRQG